MSYIQDIALRIFHESGESDDTFSRGDSILWLSYAALALTKGEATTSRDVHEAWSVWASYAYRDDHRSLIPFDELTPEIQSYDDPYRDAIRRVARGL